jgi:hypothetical protein
MAKQGFVPRQVAEVRLQKDKQVLPEENVDDIEAAGVGISVFAPGFDQDDVARLQAMTVTISGMQTRARQNDHDFPKLMGVLGPRSMIGNATGADRAFAIPEEIPEAEGQFHVAGNLIDLAEKQG